MPNTSDIPKPRRLFAALPEFLMSTRLEAPHVAHRDSYRELVDEFLRAGEPLVPFPLSFPNDAFDAFLARLAAAARGEGLSIGTVPHSTFWLISEGQVVGVVNLRHQLNDNLRRMGGNIGYGVRPTARRRGFSRLLLDGALDHARMLRMTDVLLTCDKANIASARTIVGSGGELESEEFLPEHGRVTQRYRIVL